MKYNFKLLELPDFDGVLVGLGVCEIPDADGCAVEMDVELGVEEVVVVRL